MTPTDPACDWPQDFEHENGNYLCECCHRHARFIGHKRRVQCRKCADKAQREWDAMTPEQQAEESQKIIVKMDEWLSRQAST